MTTAHRPTFDPARGKEAQRGPAYHQRLLPAHTVLKHRQPGQGGDADSNKRDLRAELLEAEARHFAKKNGTYVPEEESAAEATSTSKRPIEAVTQDEEGEADEAEQKRRRIEMLEKYREIDADDSSASSESSDDEDEDDEDEDEDEMAALHRELEKIKRERAEAKAKEDAQLAAEEEEQREFDIARGNPLLNPRDFTMKRRWDDDVVFKNQARGTETKKELRYINDTLRSDFHRKFISKYVR